MSSPRRLVGADVGRTTPPPFRERVPGAVMSTGSGYGNAAGIPSPRLVCKSLLPQAIAVPVRGGGTLLNEVLPAPDNGSSLGVSTKRLVSPPRRLVSTPTVVERVIAQTPPVQPPSPPATCSCLAAPYTQQAVASQYVTEQELSAKLDALRSQHTQQIQVLEQRVNQLMADTLPRCERSLKQVEKAWEPWLEEHGVLVAKVQELQAEVRARSAQQDATQGRLSQAEAMVGALREQIHSVEASCSVALVGTKASASSTETGQQSVASAHTPTPQDILALESMVHQLRRDTDRALQTTQLETQKELLTLQGQYQKMEVAIAERLRREIDMALDVLERQVIRHNFGENGGVVVTAVTPERPTLNEQRQEMEAISAGLQRDLSMRPPLAQML
mmetsp:Transcript_6694/g.11729  ORF Transcript_6694/g.11729 Transcript_6694/m.11729 type:complete len:388 (-) Transcript_6694:65-1228(-)